MAPTILVHLTVAVISSCTTHLGVAFVQTTVPRCVFSQTPVMLTAESSEEDDRRENEIREHQSADAAQRARELRDRAADTEKDVHDVKIPSSDAHDFYKSF